MSHRERILRDLAAGSWICGAEWLADFLPTYSQRISEINAGDPGRIEGRRCQQMEHRHRARLFEYRDRTVIQLRMRGIA